MADEVPAKTAYFAVFWLTVGLFTATIVVSLAGEKGLGMMFSHLGAIGFGYLTGGYRQRVEGANQ